MIKRNMVRRLLQIGLVILVAMSFASTLSAQKKNKAGGGVIRLEETVIEGRVQKPNAFFINTRQALVYESMALNESFVEEITKAAESDAL